ncbi:MAG: hypothetical protein SFU91_11180 [Chloroherpetonaceae bacterium]|nr:hypothetical protein [Chloroherpetonaceae bacterium]
MSRYSSLVKWILSLSLSPGVMFLWLYLGAGLIQEHLLLPHVSSSLKSHFSSKTVKILDLDFDFTGRTLLWQQKIHVRKMVLACDTVKFASEPFEIRPLSFLDVLQCPTFPIALPKAPIRFLPVTSLDHQVNFKPPRSVLRIEVGSKEDSLLSAAWQEVLLWNDEKRFFESKLRLLKLKESN